MHAGWNDSKPVRSERGITTYQSELEKGMKPQIMYVAFSELKIEDIFTAN
jgi:hypothetical protein